MNKRQFILMMSVVMLMGIVSYLPAALEVFGNRHEGESGNKDMVAKLNTNFTALGGTENIRIYQGTVTTVHQTIHTNTYATPFTAVPTVICMENGIPMTNVITSASNTFQIAFGTTNRTFRYIAIGTK